jgi:hypothetical protein
VFLSNGFHPGGGVRAQAIFDKCEIGNLSFPMLKSLALQIRSFANSTYAMLAILAILGTPTNAGEEDLKSGTASLTKPELVLPKRSAIEIERRHVASGVSTVVLSLVSLDAECNSMELPEIEIISAPKHGLARVISEEDFIQLEKDSVKGNKCSDTEMPASRVYYQSNSEYRGTDQIIVRGIWTQSGYSKRTFRLIIHVR